MEHEKGHDFEVVGAAREWSKASEGVENGHLPLHGIFMEGGRF